VGSLTSHNPIGLQGLLQGALLYFTYAATLSYKPKNYGGYRYRRIHKQTARVSHKHPLIGEEVKNSTEKIMVSD
jgi:hypothetical protein